MEENKSGNKALIISLFAVALALAGLLGYLFFTTGGKPEDFDKVISDNAVVEELKPETETPSTDTNANTTAAQKADVDKDLVSLDTLDLSGVENAYTEDSLLGL